MSAQAQTQPVAKKAKKTVAAKEETVAAPAAPAVKEEAVAAPAATSEEPKKRTRKSKAQKAAENGDAEEPRKVVNGESVQKDMEELINYCTEQLAAEIDKKASKIVRAIASKLRRLRGDMARVIKKSTKSSAPKDASKLSNSGLMKPVAISAELAAFMKVPAGTLQSRVAVTNAICAHIKTNNLQNPANKREILPDTALINLLAYTGDKAQTKLTYFYIQQLIQQHFVKSQ
jgi:chromatin remodeling complex protein RSC6